MHDAHRVTLKRMAQGPDVDSEGIDQCDAVLCRDLYDRELR